MSKAVETNARILAVLTQHRERSDYARAELDAGRLTEAGAFDVLSKASARFKWAENMDAAEQWGHDFEARADKAVADYLTGLTQPSGSLAEQQLAELRGGRAWERIRRILDAEGSDLVALSLAADRLAATNDPAERGALLQEVPDYLAARGDIPEATIRERLAAALAGADLAFKYAVDYAQYAGGVRSVVVNNADLARRTVSALRQPNSMELRVQSLDLYPAPVQPNPKVVEGVGVWDSIAVEWRPILA